MRYNLVEFTIKDLIDLIDKDLIDLNPSYQRNFIWSPKDQKELIDTIILGYPLPNFFIYKMPNGKYEMVDGQQRSKTIFRFIKGSITSSKLTNSVNFESLDKNIFLEYKLPVILIEDVKSNESLKEFYVWINKKGVHLNESEVNKSDYHDTLFLKLASEVLSYQNFINLDLFSDNTTLRMNDRAFVEELLGYLHFGIKEKKKSVEAIYDDKDFSEKDYKLLKSKFELVIDKINICNIISPINKTRYKQKNDFYTFFNFIDENINDTQELLNYQYLILIFLSGKDNRGLQHIRPTNDECESLKNYAINCVSQSNSKNAREKRLFFFNAILKNIDLDKNEILKDVINYFNSVCGLELDLINKENYYLIDLKNS